jgi:hypothetical protein
MLARFRLAHPVQALSLSFLAISFSALALPAFAADLAAAGSTSSSGSSGSNGAPTAVGNSSQKPDTYPSHDMGRGDSTRTSAGVGEDWKGQPSSSQGSFSAMLGMAVLDDYRPAFALIGAASKKIIDRGFVPDLNDSVSIEAELGPVFALGGTALFYSAHLRWDFVYNPTWTFYALGGLAGSVQGDTFGNHFVLLPRLGAGALCTITDAVGVRFELSHELIVVGATFPF